MLRGSPEKASLNSLHITSGNEKMVSDEINFEERRHWNFKKVTTLMEDYFI